MTFFMHTTFILNKSPLEQFEVTNIFSLQFPIFGYFTLTITNLALYSLIVLIVSLGLHYLGNNESKLIPSKWSIAFESLYTTLSTIVRDQIGSQNERYLPAKGFGKTLIRVKLPNSGEPLKLLIPSYSWKAISGQNNYLGMVTSQKMSENEMGYRGSKSKFLIQIPQPNKFKFFVKEQRVDGSCFGFLKYNKSPKLRCTLMGSERNYQVMIPSKQLNIKSFSTLNIKPELDPWFITGLIDAEGSFSILIIKDIRRTLGWRVECKFQLGLHKRDLPLLLEILKYFSGIGSIYSSTTSNLVNYSIHSNKQLLTLINHFNKYPLITQAPKGVEQIIYYLKK